MHLVERAHKVCSRDLNTLNVVGDARHRADLDVPVECKTRCALDQTVELGAAKVLGERRELGDVDVLCHDTILLHLARVNVEDLHAARLVWQGDLNVYLEAPGPEERLVDHVLAVGHADDEHVVELINTVHLGEQLVDDRVADACTAVG